MNAQRYNIFNKIHKGLKVMLYETATTVQQTDFSNEHQLGVTLAKIESVLSAFDMHANHEDKFILPFAAEFDAEIMELFEAEHIMDSELAIDIRTDLAILLMATDTSEIARIGRHLYFKFNEYLAFNFYHMVKEEKLINKVLWDNYTDDQIRGMEASIVASIAPEMLVREGKWMMKGMSDREITEWLMEMKFHIPEEMFMSFIKMAEDVLEPSRWHSVHTNLTEGILVT